MLCALCRFLGADIGYPDSNINYVAFLMPRCSQSDLGVSHHLVPSSFKLIVKVSIFFRDKDELSVYIGESIDDDLMITNR